MTPQESDKPEKKQHRCLYSRKESVSLHDYHVVTRTEEYCLVCHHVRRLVYDILSRKNWIDKRSEPPEAESEEERLIG